MRRLAPAIGLLVAGAIGCATAAPATPEDSSSVVSLHVGEKAQIRGEIVLMFVGVPQDSRCPRGVQCIAAGRALVLLEATPRGGETVALQLDTSRKSEAEIGSVSVTLLSLDPAPVGERSISPAEYVLRLSIR